MLQRAFKAGGDGRVMRNLNVGRCKILHNMESHSIVLAEMRYTSHPAMRKHFLPQWMLAASYLLASGCGEGSRRQPAQPATNDAQVDASQTASEETPSRFKDKTAAEWIEQLQGSSDVNSRVAAAEALGYMARERAWTLGGFSDVPFVSDEPPKLSAAALKPIVAALVAGLNDSDGRARASAAVAVSWIGERASAAVPELIRLLKDGHDDARKNAVTAIGQIGPAAKTAIPQLKPMLAGSDAYSRVNVAEALRLIGAPPETTVPTLIELLGQDGYGSAAHYAAMELSRLGDPAVGTLKRELQSENAIMRMEAAYTLGNMAGWGNLKNGRESVADALIELTSDPNPDVAFKAVQALGSVKAAPDRSIPALVSLLEHTDQSVVGEAAKSLGDFGAEAKPALPALVTIFRDGNDQHFDTIAMAVREIGIDRVSADAIRTVKIGEAGSWLFIPMCEFPKAAVEFLQGNPEVVDVSARDHDALIRLMRAPDPRFEPLQELLFNSEKLSLGLLAELGEARFLPLLERKLKTADAHEKTHLEACARACGAAAQRVVTISESESGDFKPKSAWPDTDPTRMSPEMRGHGDGFTTVIITGRILGAGGRPVVAPKFYRLNDAWLLGKRTRDEVPIKFDKETGRFVFVDNVFAAYSMRDALRAPGHPTRNCGGPATLSSCPAVGRPSQVVVR